MGLRSATIPVESPQVPNIQALLDRIAELERNQRKPAPLRPKVTPKGLISINKADNKGFPCTLSAEVWLYFLDHSLDIKAFIEEHRTELSQ